MTTKFKAGDLVVNKISGYLWEVEAVDYYGDLWVGTPRGDLPPEARSLPRGSYSSDWREAVHFNKFPFQKQPNQCEQKEKLMNDQLYSFKRRGEEIFCKIIANHPDGGVVIREEGKEGSVDVIDKNLLTKIMPYTVSVVYLSGSNTKAYHFFANKGEFKLGDLVSNNNYPGLMRVTALNTECSNATKYLKGKVYRTDIVVD